MNVQPDSHSHPHHHHHGHAHAPSTGTYLYVALALTLGFAAVEAVGGWFTGSLALLGDAGHMLSDALALGLSAFALWISKRPPSVRHSYGFVRAEIVAALLNGMFMLLVVLGIGIEAIKRLQEPQAIAGGAVMAIAAVGLVVNLIVMLLLTRGEQNLNIRGAMLHVMGDLLGSVAALTAGAVIYFTGWTQIDPILSFVICALILYSTSHLLREAVHVLMEGVPTHIDLAIVGKSMAEMPGALSIHDLHIWTLASGRLALSAHVVVKDMVQWALLLNRLRAMLHDRFSIDHVTLQPELVNELKPADFTAFIPIQPQDRRH